MGGKNRLLPAFLAVVLGVSLCACAAGGVAGRPPASEEPGSVPRKGESTEESELPADDGVPPQDEGPANDTGDTALVTDTTGNLSYTYREGLRVMEMGGTRYIYYTETSFFFVDSVLLALEGKEAFDAEESTDYFEAAVQSFREGGWANGIIVEGPGMVEFNGVEIWVCEIETDREDGPYTVIAAVVYLDGILSSFTLITDNAAYEAAANEFVDTLSTVRATDPQEDPMIGGGYVSLRAPVGAENRRAIRPPYTFGLRRIAC